MSIMKLPHWATTVTPLSKVIAAILFIYLPFMSFFWGLGLGNHVASINTESIVRTTPILSNNSLLHIPDEKDLADYNDKYGGWKTYSSQDYDLSLKYPSVWKLNTSQRDVDCSFDNFLKNKGNCTNLKAEKIVLTKGDKKSNKFMSITFDLYVPHKGCESCRVKFYDIYTLDKNYKLIFSILDGEVLGNLSNIYSSDESGNKADTLGFVTGKNSKYSSIPTYTFYGSAVNDTEIEELLKILESVKVN